MSLGFRQGHASEH